MEIWNGLVTWLPPLKTEGLENFRLRWRVLPIDKWYECPDYPTRKQRNNKRRGNAFVTPQPLPPRETAILRDENGKLQEIEYQPDKPPESFRMPDVKVNWGETLHIQVRARYTGEANGDWRGFRFVNMGFMWAENSMQWRRDNLPTLHPYHPEGGFMEPKSCG